MLGCSFGAWDPPSFGALGKAQEAAPAEGWPGQSGSGGQQRLEKTTFWLCPVLPKHRAQRQLPQAQAGVNDTVPVPQLSWDMGDAVIRPLSHVHRGTRSTQFVTAFCIAGMLRIPPGASVHMENRKSCQNIPPLFESQAASSQEGTCRAEVPGLGWQQPGLCRSLPGWCWGPCSVPSPCVLAHLHDVLNDRGPSGELVGLLADPLLPLRLAPAAQGGLGRRRMGTP